MKPLRLKIQYQNYELGEFAEDKTVDLEELREIFKSETEVEHQRKGIIPKNFRVRFFISKYDGNILKVEHFDEDLFLIDWGRSDIKYVKTDSFPREKTKEVITWFSEGSYSDLEEVLEFERGTYNDLKDSLKEFEIIYTHNLDVGELFVLCGGFYWLFTLFFVAAGFGTGYLILLAISVFPGVFGLTFFLLYGNYSNAATDLEVTIRSGSPIVKVYQGNDEYEFKKSDISQLIIVTGQMIEFQNPFSHYEYSKLILNDGKTIIIPFTVISPFELKKRLKGTEMTVERQFYPRIKY